MKSAILFNSRRPLLVSMALLIGLMLLLVAPWSRRDSPVPLIVYCAAVMRAPLERIAHEYEVENRTTIQLQFGGSGTLLSNLRLSQSGDLFIPADASYITMARESNLLSESLPLVNLRPVLLVARGNPVNIRGLADLQRKDVRTALANPEAASIGNVTRSILAEHGLWESTQAAIQDRGVFKPTVSDVANDVQLGTVDMGIVWNATARQYPELVALEFPEAAQAMETVMVGLLRSSLHETDARAFMQYLAENPKSLAILTELGFEVAVGEMQK